MMQQIYKIKVVILLSISFIFFSISTGFSLDFKKGDIEIHHPYINETFSGATSAAGYLTIKNHSAENVILSKVKMALGMAMLHKTLMDTNGTIKMVHLRKLEIPAYSSLVMEPSGFHVMIMDIAKPFNLADKIPATLIFENKLEIDIAFVIEKFFKKTGSNGKSGHNH